MVKILRKNINNTAVNTTDIKVLTDEDKINNAIEIFMNDDKNTHFSFPFLFNRAKSVCQVDFTRQIKEIFKGHIYSKKEWDSPQNIIITLASGSGALGLHFTDKWLGNASLTMHINGKKENTLIQCNLEYKADTIYQLPKNMEYTITEVRFTNKKTLDADRKKVRDNLKIMTPQEKTLWENFMGQAKIDILPKTNGYRNKRAKELMMEKLAQMFGTDGSEIRIKNVDRVIFKAVPASQHGTVANLETTEVEIIRVYNKKEFTVRGKIYIQQEWGNYGSNIKDEHWAWWEKV